MYRKWETGETANSAKFSIAGSASNEVDYEDLVDYLTIS